MQNISLQLIERVKINEYTKSMDFRCEEKIISNQDKSSNYKL